MIIGFYPRDLHCIVGGYFGLGKALEVNTESWVCASYLDSVDIRDGF